MLGPYDGISPIGRADSIMYSFTSAHMIASVLSTESCTDANVWADVNECLMLSARPIGLMPSYGPRILNARWYQLGQCNRWPVSRSVMPLCRPMVLFNTNGPNDIHTWCHHVGQWYCVPDTIRWADTMNARGSHIGR